MMGFEPTIHVPEMISLPSVVPRSARPSFASISRFDALPPTPSYLSVDPSPPEETVELSQALLTPLVSNHDEVDTVPCPPVSVESWHPAPASGEDIPVRWLSVQRLPQIDYPPAPPQRFRPRHVMAGVAAGAAVMAALSWGAIRLSTASPTAMAQASLVLAVQDFIGSADVAPARR